MAMWDRCPKYEKKTFAYLRFYNVWVTSLFLGINEDIESILMEKTYILTQVLTRDKLYYYIYIEQALSLYLQFACESRVSKGYSIPRSHNYFGWYLFGLLFWVIIPFTLKYIL